MSFARNKCDLRSNVVCNWMRAIAITQQSDHKRPNVERAKRGEASQQITTTPFDKQQVLVVDAVCLCKFRDKCIDEIVSMFAMITIAELRNDITMNKIVHPISPHRRIPDHLYRLHYFEWIFMTWRWIRNSRIRISRRSSEHSSQLRMLWHQ